MPLSKRKYKVYRRYVVDNPEIGVAYADWYFMGETYAGSEAKAISNLMYRAGKGWGDADMGHNVSCWYEWKAVEV